MRPILIPIVCLLVALFCMPAQSHSNDRVQADRLKFVPVHVYLDCGDESLAAYQFEFKAVSEQIKIVGVEGGDHPAFNEPPYYDPDALMNDRIIIAAFNTGSDLPKGKTRVVTLHLQVVEDITPEYEVQLITAANADGRRIPVEITYEQGDNQ